MAWLTKLSIVPAIFNINELLIFGLPIVLNPIFLIPFVLVPVVLACVSYLAISMGLVSIVVQSVHWTTPPLLSGYIATNSWSGVWLQLIEVAVGTSIYLPFVIINEKQKVGEIHKTFDNLLDEVNCDIPQFQRKLLTRQDELGTLTRMLAYDLKSALANGELFLAYQPQVNECNSVIGVEALLRWTHKLYGRIPPMLTVAVAEEAGLIQDIGKWVIYTACQELSYWKSIGIEGIRMSVNVSAVQLQNESFADDVLAIIRANDLRYQDIEIIASITSLCSSLDIAVIVEYVETQDQRDLLKKLGCMQYQGYYYSQPLVSSQLVDYVLSQNKPNFGVPNL